MPLQTAPATVTVATTGGNTVYTLADVADNRVQYRITQMGGSAVQLKDAPVLTITRRPASRTNPNVKYSFVQESASYDVTGAVVGRVAISNSGIFIGSRYEPVMTELKVEEQVKAFGLFLGNSTVQSAISDGSFLR